MSNSSKYFHMIDMGYTDEQAFDEIIFDSLEAKRLDQLQAMQQPSYNPNYECEVCSSGHQAVTSVHGVLVCSESCALFVSSGEFNGVHKE